MATVQGGSTAGWGGEMRTAHKFICRDCLPSHKYRVNELFSSWNLHMHLNAAVCFTRGLGSTSGLSVSGGYDLWHLKLRVTVTLPTFWGNRDEKTGCCEENNVNFFTETPTTTFIVFLTLTYSCFIFSNKELDFWLRSIKGALNSFHVSEPRAFHLSSDPVRSPRPPEFLPNDVIIPSPWWLLVLYLQFRKKYIITKAVFVRYC